MRYLLGPLPCRASASALVLAPVRAPGTARATGPAAPEAPRIPFAERCHALPRGGFARAADPSRAELRLPEPGGAHEELLADTVVGHRAGRGADAVQASADVTAPVRSGGPGLSPDTPAEVRPNGLHAPRGADGRTGPVAYNGDRGGTGDSLTYTTAGRAPVPLQDSADPADDVLDSTINEPGPVRARREPAYANTLGYGSDVFDLGTGLAQGGDQLTFRLVSQRDAAWAGALFAAVDAR
ncbi:MAG: hypothetical protein JF597_27950 [Streptomyces sp.]|uniref:hypothetical protein n=1 Tax=Streptomyces sp. TaxID=1931 RepID=UPI0025EB7554|nr:hypothetical protein [Streptomyces sp.]MBW8797291.1 hypothetical protein [Streptomyces sp.]